jgi:hypothetical protein
MEASTQVLGSEEVPASPGSAAKLISEGGKPAVSFQLRIRFALFWRDPAGRSRSPICVGEKKFLLLWTIPGSSRSIMYFLTTRMRGERRRFYKGERRKND